jgi:hypothetical protein
LTKLNFYYTLFKGTTAYPLNTRLKKGASIQVEQVFTKSYGLRDSLVRLGSGTAKTPFITLRLIEVRLGKTWHSYLTSVLELRVLPP